MATTDSVTELIARYGLLSDQVDQNELAILLRQLKLLLQQSANGSVVEFGCYSGTTSVYISRILRDLDKPHTYHVYDSFCGLPEKSLEDQSALGTQFVAGELSASKKTFMANFYKANLKLPIIHKGWFNELSSDDIPANICFAFLDGDYYLSIKDSLSLIQDKLSPKALIIIDDYANAALPGVKKAVDAWTTSRPCELQIQSSLAILYT